eukprot:9105831-Pyramimonas_sp.AAC.1
MTFGPAGGAFGGSGKPRGPRHPALCTLSFSMVVSECTVCPARLERQRRPLAVGAESNEAWSKLA